MNYYNEHDKFAAMWLRELIRQGCIPAGDVDERSIEDVRPNELRGYTQCHFFAGIGGWSYALDLAGWPRDVSVWTGSCPCQSFSTAGKGLGFADQRHLWPAWFHLIRECRPDVVFGEQVSAAIRHGWLDLVSADMEAEGYAIGAAVLGAHSVGAPVIGNRLFFVAEANRAGRAWPRQAQPKERSDHPFISGGFKNSRGADGRTRPIDPRPYGLGYGVSSRVAFNRAYGNAICPQTAAAFIGAWFEVSQEPAESAWRDLSDGAVVNRRGYEMLHAVREAGGHHVYSLRCGAIGTVHGLFNLAKALGFNGTKQCFAKRLHKTPDSTLLELAAPIRVVNKPKPRDNSEVLAAIAALDARKRDAK